MAAIDFPTPTDVGETFTDVAGITYICRQVGPPAIWAQDVSGGPGQGVVTTDTPQTISGAKTFTATETLFGTLNDNVTLHADGEVAFTGGVTPTRRACDTVMDLNTAISWTFGGTSFPNPTNASPGQSGTILLTAIPDSWGANWSGPAVASVPSVPSICPYLVNSASEVYVGAAVPTS